MKALKILGIILLVIVGLFFAAALVAPSELSVERSITIEAPAQIVVDNVVCLDKWPAWSAWAAMDPEMENEYSEDPCGTGAWNSWKGEKAGIGKQTVAAVNGTESINMDLVFDGFDGVNHANWTFSEADGVTTVTWDFQGATSPFMFRPMNLMMKGVLEEAYDKGLASLKEVAESAPASEVAAYEVQEIELPETKYLLISGDVEPQNIGAFYGENFGKIMGYMEQAGAALSGYPSGMFYSWSDTLAKMSAAVPIDKEVTGTDEIEYRVLEAGQALLIDYYGAYDKSEAAHYAMDNYLNDNGLELAGAVLEEYVTDPGEEPDTSKWLTRIIYPVSSADVEE